MIDQSKYKEFNISEKDIDDAIHILKVLKNIDATPEDAIEFLTWLRTEIHTIAHNRTPEELIELYDQFAKQK
jgi:hypothetical protein